MKRAIIAYVLKGHGKQMMMMTDKNIVLYSRLTESLSEVNAYFLQVSCCKATHISPTWKNEARQSSYPGFKQYMASCLTKLMITNANAR